MNAIQYNDYWISTDTYLTQPHRDENAKLIATYLFNLGWTREAIAGILGNMDVESTMNPAYIQGGNDHTLIDNNTCLNLGGSIGVGLVQWTGTTPTAPAGQKLASFAIRHNKNWYDGELQCERLDAEYQNNLQFQAGTVDGQHWDWQTYVTSTDIPEQLAKVWQLLYENGGSDTATRQRKARYYYKLIRQNVPIWLYFIMARKRKELKPKCQRI